MPMRLRRSSARSAAARIAAAQLSEESEEEEEVHVDEESAEENDPEDDEMEEDVEVEEEETATRTRPDNFDVDPIIPDSESDPEMTGRPPGYNPYPFSSYPFKIKLKLPVVPSTANTSAAATPAPDDVSPSKSVSRRRRSKDVDIESEDEDDEDNDNDDSRGTSTVGAPARPMTTRQAVLASVVDSSHVSLDEGSRNKKKVLNENELALRREETARKRKNLSEKKLEDEKVETINRLLKKQSRPKNKRTAAVSLSEDRTPNVAGSRTPTAPDDEEALVGEEVEAEVPPPDPMMYRWISSSRGSDDGGEKKMWITFSVPTCVAVPTSDGEGKTIVTDGDGDVEMTRETETKNDRATTQSKRMSPAEISLPTIARPTCAVPNCGAERKYRWVKDWQIGACGMAHLKLLESNSVGS